nr:hypothetical protein [Tanacetum cinerariifolium]
MKTKKKIIPPSSKPKSPYKVRVILPKKQVVETQNAEVTASTADATKGLEASELAEDQGNQPLTAKSVKAAQRPWTRTYQLCHQHSPPQGEGEQRL